MVCSRNLKGYHLRGKWSTKYNYFQILGCIDNHSRSKWSEEIATVIGVGCDFTKHFTLSGTYHNCTKEGWDLVNVYRLQSIEQDYNERSKPFAHDWWFIRLVTTCKIFHQIGSQIEMPPYTCKWRRHLKHCLQYNERFVWMVGHAICLV